MRLDWLLKPTSLVAIPVAVSFAVWAVPGESASLRGFAHRSEATFSGVALLVLWYAACLAGIWFCVRVGRKVPTIKSLRQFDDSPSLELHFYWFLTVVASIGIVASVITIAQSVSIWDSLVHSNANVMAAALPGRAGFETLRYATAIAAPVGVYLWMKKTAPIGLAILNLALLVVNVMLDSRLSLILAVLVYLFLLARGNRSFRLKVWVAVAAIGVLLGGLTAFNYVRNSNYYEQLGITNPIAMNFFQVAGYLGAPAQVSIGVAGAITDGRLIIPGAPVASLGAVIPEFLVLNKSGVPQHLADRYGNMVSIANNFNANSAFADTYGVFGFWGLAYIFLGFALAAFLFGVFVRYRSVVSIIPGVVLYGFAETWRLFLFNHGILIFLLLSAAGGILFALSFPWAARWATVFRSTRSKVRSTPSKVDALKSTE